VWHTYSVGTDLFIIDLGRVGHLRLNVEYDGGPPRVEGARGYPLDYPMENPMTTIQSKHGTSLSGVSSDRLRESAVKRRYVRSTLCVAVVALCVSACGSSVGLSSSGSGSQSTQGGYSSGVVSGSTAHVSGSYQLISEPEAGFGPIYAQLSSAKASLDVSMYEMVDRQAESIMAQDAARGVNVRVILDHNREAGANQSAFDYLGAHGVSVVWAPGQFTADHEKAFVIDNATAVVMSANLTSRYYPSTRDFAVIDTNSADVAAIEATFASDFSGASAALVPGIGSDLVWSPTTSYNSLVGLINSSTKSLSVENEEMANTGVISALVNASGRGVVVNVTMTDDPSWSGAFATLSAGGVHVATYGANADLYIHAKVIVVDAGSSDQAAFVGSQNFSTASLNYNRELGIITSDLGVVAGLNTVLNSDFANATAWSK
jgi:cardiolipin synthase